MDNLEEIYNLYNINKNKNKVGNWVIVNEDVYNLYKNKLKITSIQLYNGKNELTGRKEKFILAETKSDYILIKYNSNFIAINVCQREYELTNNINLIMINSNSLYNIENNIGEPPEIKEIFKVLGWKIARKAIKNLEELE